MKQQHQKRRDPDPPTYPARPINGGRLDLAEEKDPEEWRYRPKFNGRRVLLHLPTMRTWNKELVENNGSFLPSKSCAISQINRLLSLSGSI
jgi:hypothetical protein